MSTPTSLFCSECGKELTQEQLERISNGETVNCTSCSKPIKVQVVKIGSQPATKTTPEAKGGLFKGFGDGLKKMGDNIKKATTEAGDKIKSTFEPKTETTTAKSSSTSTAASPQKAKPAPAAPVKQNSYQSNRSTSYSPPPQPEPKKQTPNPTKASTPPPVLETEVVPEFELPQNYRAVRKFNDFSGLFAFLIAIIVALIYLIPFFIELPTNGGNPLLIPGMIDQLVRIGIAFFIAIFDAAYARRKVLRMQFQNYGLDYILIGGFGLIAYFSGLFLMIKGVLVMVLAFTEKHVDFGKSKNFGDAVFSALNSVGGLYGIAILLLNIEVFFNLPNGNLTKTYAIMAAIAILVDIAVLRPLIDSLFGKQGAVVLSIVLIVDGILASFFHMAGLVIIVQGVILLFIEFFRN